MAPQAKLVFLKALNSDGVGTELGVARAIRAATARKVDLINLSLGFYTVLDATPSGVEAAVADAVDAGITVVAAAGNDAVSSPAYPAFFPGVTGVGALATDGASIADFSNYGSVGERVRPGRAGAERVRAGTGGRQHHRRPRRRPLPLQHRALERHVLRLRLRQRLPGPRPGRAAARGHAGRARRRPTPPSTRCRPSAALASSTNRVLSPTPAF